MIFVFLKNKQLKTINFGFENKELLSNIHHGFCGKNKQLFVKDLAKVVAYKKKSVVGIYYY